VFSETVSGAITDRKELRRAIACLSQGDLLIITKLDRLARSTRDLLNTLASVSDRGAGFRVLDNPALDTTSSHGNLLLNILGSKANLKGSLSRLPKAGQGQATWCEVWKEAKLTLHQIKEVLARKQTGEAMADIGRSYNVSHSTVSLLA